MELKYEFCVQRKIVESNFIYNLNQIIPDDKTLDMAVFVGHVQAVSKYLILTDIPNITRDSNLTRARPVPKVMDVSFDFQVV